jgi:hypothetical protein
MMDNVLREAHRKLAHVLSKALHGKSTRIVTKSTHSTASTGVVEQSSGRQLREEVSAFGARVSIMFIGRACAIGRTSAFG